jgi:hypothetical protein
MKQFLMQKAREDTEHDPLNNDYCEPIVSYVEDINPDAAEPDNKWLISRSSFI